MSVPSDSPASDQPPNADAGSVTSGSATSGNAVSGNRGGDPPPPHWQLPPGVTRSLWDYVHDDRIARDYDAYFSHNRLFLFDQQILLRELVEGQEVAGRRVADLGCGTARALVPLVKAGYRGLAVDLSEKMLDIVRAKAQSEQLDIECRKANWVELDEFADESLDHAISMFSTLGMIRGRENRQRALEHTFRLLKPGGKFILHVHNYWYNLYDPGGPWWLIKNLCSATFRGAIERGDKFFPYRGLPSMFLHVFTRREIVGALRKAGFRMHELIPLDPRRHRRLAAPWAAGDLRANGWILIAVKPC